MGALSLRCVSPRAQGAEASGGTPNSTHRPPQAAAAHSLACWPSLRPSLWPLSLSDHPAAWAAAAKGAARKGLICSSFHQQLGGLPRPTGWVPGRLPPSVGLGRRRDHRAALPSAFLPRECECVSDSCRLPEPIPPPLSSRPAPAEVGAGARRGVPGALACPLLLLLPGSGWSPELRGEPRKPCCWGTRGERMRSGFRDGALAGLPGARTAQAQPGLGSCLCPSCPLLSSPRKFQPSHYQRPQFPFPERASFAFDLS